jgi:hypothetical protein
MSRAYQISVSESVRRHVRVADGIRTSLELLDVLPADAMCGLLAAELQARGFCREGEHMVRVEEDGIELRVGVSGDQAGQVTVRLCRDREVELTVSRSRRTEEEHAERERQALHDEVAAALARGEREAHARLGAEVTQTLERKLRDLGRELDGIASRVTAEALKVRAGQLGEIQEISEDPETGSLTIKVKV